jgi:hypothetical protein
VQDEEGGGKLEAGSWKLEAGEGRGERGEGRGERGEGRGGKLNEKQTMALVTEKEQTKVSSSHFSPSFVFLRPPHKSTTFLPSTKTPDQKHETLSSLVVTSTKPNYPPFAFSCSLITVFSCHTNHREHKQRRYLYVSRK